MRSRLALSALMVAAATIASQAQHARDSADRDVLAVEQQWNDALRAFWWHYWNTASCCYPDVTGDLVSVTRQSDFYTDRERIVVSPSRTLRYRPGYRYCRSCRQT